MNPPLTAVILAAGSGRRIGTPKLRLPAVAGSFLQHTAARLRQAGIGAITVVVRPADADWARALAPDFAMVVNPHPEAGMLSSLACALRQVGPGHAIMVVPVDHPGVAVSTYATLAEAGLNHPLAVIKPCWQGRPGHPVIIPPDLAALAAHQACPSGLRGLITGWAGAVYSVAVADPGIVCNINTAADLAAYTVPPPS